jgi:tRNA threonylcarbamoyladenosine modification (KEOPS) complex  Pcc1 subunit
LILIRQTASWRPVLGSVRIAEVIVRSSETSSDSSQSRCKLLLMLEVSLLKFEISSEDAWNLIGIWNSSWYRSWVAMLVRVLGASADIDALFGLENKMLLVDSENVNVGLEIDNIPLMNVGFAGFNGACLTTHAVYLQDLVIIAEPFFLGIVGELIGRGKMDKTTDMNVYRAGRLHD